MQDDLNRLASENLREKVRTNFIEIGGVFLPEEYKSFANAVENFEVFSDDIWVCSFQKSGTTWTQEMVWCIANSLDFEGAKVPINERFPYLEFSGLTTTSRVAFRESRTQLPDWINNSVEFCAKLSKPRFIKSHLPLQLLPRQLRNREKKPKIIYVARNPKDVCVSFYHHSVLMDGFCGDFELFCKLFLADKVAYSPYWNHIKGFWDRRNEENIHFIKYEDMKLDLPSVIRRTATFIGKILNEEQVQILAEHLNFENVRNNSALNREASLEWIKKFKILGEDPPGGKFIRKGTVGQWKADMSDEIIQNFDEWIEKESKQCEGLSFFDNYNVKCNFLKT